MQTFCVPPSGLQDYASYIHHTSARSHVTSSLRESKLVVAKHCAREIHLLWGAWVDKWLDDPMIHIGVTSPDNDPQKVLGFVAYQTSPVPTIHFMHTRGGHRRQGIGWSLLEHVFRETAKNPNRKSLPVCQYTTSSRDFQRFLEGVRRGLDRVQFEYAPVNLTRQGQTWTQP
jgi:GNAT superfamily N-acetyltransferase